MAFYRFHIFTAQIIRTDVDKIEDTYGKPIPNIVLNGEKLKLFPLKSSTASERQLSHDLMHIKNDLIEVGSKMVDCNKERILGKGGSMDTKLQL
jgi:hypothetical protein